MKETVFYMHLASQNLAQYFGCACLKPSKYINESSDCIQTRFENFIVLSNKRYAKEVDCSLELVLTYEEQSGLIPINSSQNIFLLSNALPITRIKKIYFKSENTKDKITTLVNMSSAFIPANLATVKTDNYYADYSNIKLPFDLKTIDLSEKIKKYNSLLGGFALMRLGGEDYMNYSQNYFSTLSRFNTAIEAELLKANRKINTIYWDAFEGLEKFKSLFSYVNKKISEQDLYEVAKIENQRIQKSTVSGIIDINSLDRASYMIAILYSYGLGDEGKKNKIDGLIINNFKKEIKPETSEAVSLFYGLNRGYAAFTNKYKLDTKEKIVKFELNSQLDYYTIESIYQFAFNNIAKNAKFPYLDDWCLKFSEQKLKIKKSHYIILDKAIISEQIKVGSLVWWSNIMQFFFQKDNEDLFKPFMLKVFEKIKTDIQEETLEIIEQKNDEILKLKNENKELMSKDLLNCKLNEQIDLLKMNLDKVKEEHKVVYEKNLNYAKSSDNPEISSDYKSMFIESQMLINELRNHTKAIKAQTLIKKFFEKYPQADNKLFDDKLNL